MKINANIAVLFSLLAGAANAASLRSADVVPETKQQQPDLHGSDLYTEFSKWTSAFNKEYTNEAHRMERFKIWAENHFIIHEHNAKESTYKMGHNAFSDLTSDEFAQRFGLGKHGVNAQMAKKKQAQKELMFRPELMEKTQAEARRLQSLKLPDYVNWMHMGGVTDVKDQGACGSCWAFSTTGALEGAKFIRTGELVALSEQNLLDCDHLDLGCNGGLMDNAFKFDEKSGGLCSEEDYPYEAVQHNTCRTDCTDVPGSIVRTFYDVPEGDEKAMLAAIAMQPISIAIQADQNAFQFYKTGVLTDDTCGESGDIDHGVLAVGYGTDLETQEPYFLVKNSWGSSWGENGYIRLGRKSSNEFGICAILKMASYPEVE